MQEGNPTSCLFWESMYLNPNSWNIWVFSQGCDQWGVQTSWNVYLTGLYVPFHINLDQKTPLSFSLEKWQEFPRAPNNPLVQLQ